MHLKRIKKGLAISLVAAMVILSNTYSIKAMENEDYSPEIDYSENANSKENDITGLTDEEFDTLYNQFLEHYKNVDFNSDDENIDAFIEYAIAVGAIKDTPQARDVLSVTYVANCKKVSGKWNITVTVKDRYDFAYQKWGSYRKGLSNAAKVALNNYGYNAQKVGAIKNYNISITINS